MDNKDQLRKYVDIPEQTEANFIRLLKDITDGKVADLEIDVNNQVSIKNEFAKQTAVFHLENSLSAEQADILLEAFSEKPAMEKLKYLSLVSQNIDNDNVKAIKKLRNIEWLNLNDNDITDPSPINKMQLTHLNLSNNDIGDDGLRNIILLPNLLDLNLSNSNITNVSPVYDISTHFSQLSSKGKERTSAREHLVNVDLSHNNIKDVSSLFTLKGLQNLDLDGTKISRIQVRRLSSLVEKNSTKISLKETPEAVDLLDDEGYLKPEKEVIPKKPDLSSTWDVAEANIIAQAEMLEILLAAETSDPEIAELAKGHMYALLESFAILSEEEYGEMALKRSENGNLDEIIGSALQAYVQKIGLEQLPDNYHTIPENLKVREPVAEGVVRNLDAQSMAVEIHIKGR